MLGWTAGFDQLNDCKIQSGMPDGLPAKASVIPHRFYISYEANNQIALRFFKSYKGAIHLDFALCSCCVPLSPSLEVCLLIRKVHCEGSTPSDLGSKRVRDTAIRDFNLTYP